MANILRCVVGVFLCDGGCEIDEENARWLLVCNADSLDVVPKQRCKLRRNVVRGCRYGVANHRCQMSILET